MSVLIVCDDLMFTSKVTTTARAHGLDAAIARTPAEAVRKGAAAACVLVDLHLPGLDVPALLTGLRAGGSTAQVIAFGSHVDTERLKAARDAGCDQVMPRSKFVRELETNLPQWASTPNSPGA